MKVKARADQTEVTQGGLDPSSHRSLGIKKDKDVLSAEQQALVVEISQKYDLTDFTFTNAYREGNVYNLTRQQRLHGSVRGGYWRVGIANRTHSGHVFVWTCCNGKPGKDYEIHHKNSNKLDNRLDNLDMVEAAVHRRLTTAGTLTSGKSMLCHSRRRPVKRIHEDGREELFTQSAKSIVKAIQKGLLAIQLTKKAKSGRVRGRCNTRGYA